MRRKWRLILALALLAVLAITAWLVLRPTKETAEEEPEAAADTIYSVEYGALTALQWSWEDTELSLVKENGSWSCGTAPDTTIDQSVASNLASAIIRIEYTNALDETADPAEFGFDAPRMRIRLYLGDVNGELEIGMHNDFTGGDYVRYEKDRIYLIDGALYDSFAVGLQDLVPQDTLPQVTNAAIRSLTITTPEGSRTLLHPENYAELSYAGTYQWFEEDADKMVALSPTAVSTVASAVSGLSFADCVAFQPEDPAVYGLADPSLSITVSYEITDSDTGETQRGEYSLHFGDATEPEEALIGGEEDLDTLDETPETRYVYVCMDGSELVYTADASAAETLSAAVTEELRPDDVCRVAWDTLRAMRITLDGETDRLSIDKLEDLDENGEVVTTTVYSVNSRESSYDEIYGVFKQIRFITTESVVDDMEPEGDPYLTIEFLRDTDRYSVMPLELYVYDNSFYLVKFNGAARLLVSRRDVEALAESIRALR